MYWVREKPEPGDVRFVEKYAWLPVDVETYDTKLRKYVIHRLWLEKYFHVQKYDGTRSRWTHILFILPKDKHKIKVLATGYNIEWDKIEK